MILYITFHTRKRIYYIHPSIKQHTKANKWFLPFMRIGLWNNIYRDIERIIKLNSSNNEFKDSWNYLPFQYDIVIKYLQRTNIILLARSFLSPTIAILRQTVEEREKKRKKGACARIKIRVVSLHRDRVNGRVC